MTIDSFDVLFYTTIFLLPGYIVKSVIDALVPPIRYNDTKYFFTCLLYSIINCASWSWMYNLVFRKLESNTTWYWIALLLITIIGAIILALLIGIIRQKELIKSLSVKLKINMINPVSTAWDYFFAKQEVAWVIITLKSGKIIYGWYSSQSFSSSDPDERDLYIEKIYDVDEKLCWIENKRSNGILIAKEEIETIEFLS